MSAMRALLFMLLAACVFMLLAACGTPTSVERPTTQVHPVASGIDAPASETRPVVPIAEPLGLVPPPPALPAFGARAGYPSTALLRGWRAAMLVRSRSPEPARPADASLRTVQRWAEQDLAPWLTRRREILAEAEQRLNAIAREGTPPHELAVAAALVSRIYDEFAYDFMGNAPVPTEIVGDDELLPMYAEGLWSAGERLLAQAADKLEFCASVLGRVEEQGWWSDWGAYCRARLEVVRARPSSLPLDTVRARLAVWHPAAPVEVAVPATPSLQTDALRPRGVPRAQQTLVAALDALVRGEISLLSDQPEQAREAWAAFASAESSSIESLAALREAVSAPELGSEVARFELAQQLASDHQALFEQMELVEDGTQRCWLARSAVLGIVVLEHAAAVRERDALLRRVGRDRAGYDERRRALLERARSMSDREGDDLVREALWIMTGEGLAVAELARLVEVMSTYAAASDAGGVERDAVVQAGAALAGATHDTYTPAAADEERRLSLEARIALAPEVYAAFGRGSARATLRRILGDPERAQVLRDLTHIELPAWQELAQECR